MDGSGRRHDTFVIRIWRDGVSRRILRTEVEHVQSGHRTEKRWPARTEAESESPALWLARQLLGEPSNQAEERSVSTEGQ